MRADKMNILIAVDKDGASHILGKGPEMGYAELRDLIHKLDADKGVYGELELATACIFKANGAIAKRRTFKAAGSIVFHGPTEIMEDADEKAAKSKVIRKEREETKQARAKKLFADGLNKEAAIQKANKAKRASKK